MNLTRIIAELLATSFDADRPALCRYSATVRLHTPDKHSTPKSVGYGVDADEAHINAVRKALQSWGCATIAPPEVRVSSRTLPDGYGRAYLDEADACVGLANRMPAETQAHKDLMAAAEGYGRQYLAVRYDYLDYSEEENAVDEYGDEEDDEDDDEEDDADRADRLEDAEFYDEAAYDEY